MAATKNKFLGFRVSPDEHKAVKIAATQRGRSIQEFCRERVLRDLRREKKQ